LQKGLEAAKEWYSNISKETDRCVIALAGGDWILTMTRCVDWLVGAKADVKPSSVEDDAVKQFVEAENIPIHFQTSSKENHNVAELFQAVVDYFTPTYVYSSK
jgi:hypothetical protein